MRGRWVSTSTNPTTATSAAFTTSSKPEPKVKTKTSNAEEQRQQAKKRGRQNVKFKKDCRQNVALVALWLSLFLWSLPFSSGVQVLALCFSPIRFGFLCFPSAASVPL